MTAFVAMFTNSKTKIGALLLLAVCVAEFFGVSVVEAITPQNAVEYGYAAVMIIFGRDALPNMKK